MDVVAGGLPVGSLVSSPDIPETLELDLGIMDLHNGSNTT